MADTEVFLDATQRMSLQPAEHASLAHPHQSGRLFGNLHNQVRVIPFNNPGMGKRNNVEIPSINQTWENGYIRFSVSSVAGAANPVLEPTPTWIGAQGISLRYKNAEVYNMSEAECLMSCFLDQHNQDFLREQKKMGFHLTTAESAAASVSVYLPLKPICEQFTKYLGGLGGFSSNDFSLSCDIRSAAAVISGSDAAAGTMTVDAMDLIILGFKQEASEVALQRKALSENGIAFYYLRSYHNRSEWAAEATSAVVQYSDLVGSIAQIRLLVREKAGWDAVLGSTKNNVDYNNYNLVADTLAVGKLQFNNEVFGQALPQQDVRNIIPMRAIEGSPTYHSALADSSTIESSAIVVPFNESHLTVSEALSTGGYSCKNDLRVAFAFGSTTTADYLDSVIMIYQKAVITNAQFNTQNAS